MFHEEVIISSGKIYLPQTKQYCPPGSFVRSNVLENQMVYRLLCTCSCSDLSVPIEKRNILRRSTSTMVQVVKAVAYKPVSEFDVVIPLLRQRIVNDTVEYVRVEKEVYILNEELGSVCFIHHIDDVLSGQYQCSGRRNVFVIRYSISSYTNELNDISDFRSFPDQFDDFSIYHATDLSRTIWIGLESINEVLLKIMCKSGERVGSSFYSSKSQIFSLSTEIWNYILYFFNTSDTCIEIHEFNTNSRVKRIEYGMVYKSLLVQRKWYQIRLETHDQLNLLKSLLGPYCLFGVTKGRPGKVNNYEVSGVTKYDDINVVEPLSSPTEFVRRNITTQGVDLLFCEGVGCKVWARYSRKRSSTVPDILHMINEMNRTPNNAEYESSNTLNNVMIEPGKTIFYYNNCALRVNTISDGIIQCIVLQSSNSDYATGSFICFENEDEVKAMVLSTLNM